MSRKASFRVMFMVALAFLLATIPSQTNVLAAAPAQQLADSTPCIIDGIPCNAPVSQAVEQQGVLTTTPGLQYVTYSGISFTPNRSDVGYAAYSSSIYVTSISSDDAVIRDINLPDGVYLSEVTFFYLDNDAAANMELSFIANDPASGTRQYLVNQTTFGTNSPNIQAKTITLNPAVKITNSSYSYAARIEFTKSDRDTQRFSGLRVGFSYNSYLPSINKLTP